nr:hypothetical protein CFP56_19192 [Quercus suber]
MPEPRDLSLEPNTSSSRLLHGSETAKRKRRGGSRRKTGEFASSATNSVCGNCQRLNLECRPFEIIIPSAWSTASNQHPSRQVEASRDDDRARRYSSHEDGNRQEQSQRLSGRGLRDIVSSPVAPESTWDIFRYMLEPPAVDYPPVTIAPTSSSSISASTPSAGSSHRPTSQNSGSSQVTLTNEMVYLLNNYRTGVATWMDIFDHDCTYQREVLRRCTTSELLVRSVCAFTAQNLSLLPFGGVWIQPATRYYGESLRILIDHIGCGAAPEDVLTSTMLLCSYEMIASHGVEHERHFYGAMLLILNHQVSALSVGMDRANFWIYVRHEITVALVNETTLRISPQEWNFNWQDSDVDEDALANKLLWLLGRAINVAYSQHPSSGSERQGIQTDALRWFHSLPPSFRGVRYGEADAQGFSKAYFAIPAAGQFFGMVA